MLTLERLQQSRYTTPTPGLQKVMARALTVNYALARVEIVTEVPEPAIVGLVNWCHQGPPQLGWQALR